MDLANTDPERDIAGSGSCTFRSWIQLCWIRQFPDLVPVMPDLYLVAASSRFLKKRGKLLKKTFYKETYFIWGIMFFIELIVCLIID